MQFLSQIAEQGALFANCQTTQLGDKVATSCPILAVQTARSLARTAHGTYCSTLACWHPCAAPQTLQMGSLSPAPPVPVPGTHKSEQRIGELAEGLCWGALRCTAPGPTLGYQPGGHFRQAEPFPTPEPTPTARYGGISRRCTTAQGSFSGIIMGQTPQPRVARMGGD